MVEARNPPPADARPGHRSRHEAHHERARRQPHRRDRDGVLSLDRVPQPHGRDRPDERGHPDQGQPARHVAALRRPRHRRSPFPSPQRDQVDARQHEQRADHLGQRDGVTQEHDPEHVREEDEEPEADSEGARQPEGVQGEHVERVPQRMADKRGPDHGHRHGRGHRLEAARHDHERQGDQQRHRAPRPPHRAHRHGVDTRRGRGHERARHRPDGGRADPRQDAGVQRSTESRARLGMAALPLDVGFAPWRAGAG